MNLYAVVYSYFPPTEEMEAVRPNHVKFLSQIHESGTILASGRLVEQAARGALIIIKGNSVSEVESILNQDPFYQEGYIAERRVMRWDIVFGSIG